MALLESVLARAQPVARQHGEQLAESGGVRGLVLRGDGGISAMVHDGAATFRPHGNLASSDSHNWLCDCGGVEDGRVCPHIVALLTQAARRGLTPGVNRPTLPRADGRPAAWLSASGELRRLTGAEEPRRLVHHQPAPPSWKKVLARIRDGQPEPIESQPPEAWPPERQILYIFDIPASIDEYDLTVRLAVRDRKASGQWGMHAPVASPFPTSPSCAIRRTSRSSRCSRPPPAARPCIRATIPPIRLPHPCAGALSR